MINEKLQKDLEVMTESLQKGKVSTTELAMVTKALLMLFKNIKLQLEGNIKATDTKLRLDLTTLFDDIKKLEAKTNEAIGTVSSKAQQMTLAEVSKVAKQIQKDMERMRGDMPQMPDLSAIESRIASFESVKIPDEKNIIDTIEKDIPKLSTAIRDSLELIQDEDEKLKIDAIGYLRKELDEIKKMKTIGTGFGGGGSAGGVSGHLDIYDLSSQTDGILKTFSVPGMLKPYWLLSSDFPTVLKLGNGYTYDASTNTITMTVDNAPSPGSQLQLLYSF